MGLKFTTKSAMTLLLLLCTACTAIQHRDISQLQVKAVSAMPSDPAKWQEIVNTVRDGKEYVFLIHAGEKFPLKINLVFPMAKLQPGVNNLLFTRDTYLLYSRKGLEISFDGQRWAAIADLKSQRALSGATKNEFSVSIGTSEAEGTQLAIEMVAK